jgi:hypothetical protein
MIRQRLACLTIGLFLFFALAGCAGIQTAEDSSPERARAVQETQSDTEPKQPATTDVTRGRLLMNGHAGREMVEAVRKADTSVVVMTKVFNGTDSGVARRLAETMVRKANQGVEVAVLLSDDFPVDYFSTVNDSTARFFDGTPVHVERITATGRFNYEGQFTPNTRYNSYVNSAVLLVDGDNLFAGNFILLSDDLSGTSSNIIQLHGPQVPDETRPYFQPLLSHHDLPRLPSDTHSPPAQSFSDTGWSSVEKFNFYLGTPMDRPLKTLFSRADQKVVISTDNAGDIRSHRMQAILRPLLSESERPTVELFYESCPRNGWCLPRYFATVGKRAYQYRESSHQYQRFGYVDSNWLYSGTVDLHLLYISGHYYQSMVTVKSPELVHQLEAWIQPRRRRARALQREQLQFPETTPGERLTPRQQSAVEYLKDTLRPTIREQNAVRLVDLLDEESARQLAYNYIKQLTWSDSVPRSVYRSFFRSHDLSMERPEVWTLNETTEGKALMEELLTEVVTASHEARNLFHEKYFTLLHNQLEENGDPVYFSQTKSGYRLFPRNYLPPGDDFAGAIQIHKTDGGWKLVL